ncbi:MAG: esterase-like activity of phytase family protein [Thiotrichales bacterium]
MRLVRHTQGRPGDNRRFFFRLSTAIKAPECARKRIASRIAAFARWYQVGLLLTIFALSSVSACAGPVVRLDLSDQPEVGADGNRVALRGAITVPATPVDGFPVVELSALGWDEDEAVLYALSDRGVLFWLRPILSPSGELEDVQVLRGFALHDSDGRVLKGERGDAEGLALRNADNGRRGDTELLIAFEIQPRIARFNAEGRQLGKLTLPQPLRRKSAYSRPNDALEAVTVHPRYGVLTTPERPLRADPQAVVTLYALSGETWRVPRLDPAHSGVVALEALDDGSVLMLERAFVSYWQPLRLALKRIWLAPDCAAPATADCRYETVALWHRIDSFRADNFEGLTRFRDDRYLMVSDANDLPLLGTVLVQFEWRPRERD